MSQPATLLDRRARHSPATARGVGAHGASMRWRSVAGEWEAREAEAESEARALREMSVEERREHADLQLGLWQAKEAEAEQDGDGRPLFFGSSEAEPGRCFWSVYVGPPGEALATGARTRETAALLGRRGW
eukprot:COSAG01_NODE_2017_length_8638_cov_15.453917_4_plen_131_part_00